ncbi:uncharacterized protein LOC117972506 [Tachysurus ichikawai]
MDQRGYILSCLSFEHNTDQEGWCWAKWMSLLIPLLTGEAQLAYHAVDQQEADNYEVVCQFEEIGRTRQEPPEPDWMSPPC